MRTVLAGALLTMLAAAGCGSTNAESQAVAGYDFGKIDKIAIVEVTGRVYGDAVKNQISNLFTMKLMEKGYKFIERKDIKALLKEHEFQASDLTTKEGAAKAGKFLNVPAVMIIDIPRYSNGKMDMTAKLIDVENGTILWIGNGTGNTNKGLSTFLGAAAGAALGAAVGGHSTGDRVIGGVIGGVAGGVAGNVLAPEEEALLGKVITKVVASFPSRIAQPVTR
jgi:phosphopantetheinyl transferase (holo-ACP synthase)